MQAVLRLHGSLTPLFSKYMCTDYLKNVLKDKCGKYSKNKELKGGKSFDEIWCTKLSIHSKSQYFFFNLNPNCPDLLDLRNLQEQVKKPLVLTFHCLNKLF